MEVDAFDVLFLLVLLNDGRWWIVAYVRRRPEGKVNCPKCAAHAPGPRASLEGHAVDFVQGVWESEVGEVTGSV